MKGKRKLTVLDEVARLGCVRIPFPLHWLLSKDQFTYRDHETVESVLRSERVLQYELWIAISLSQFVCCRSSRAPSSIEVHIHYWMKLLNDNSPTRIIVLHYARARTGHCSHGWTIFDSPMIRFTGYPEKVLHSEYTALGEGVCCPQRRGASVIRLVHKWLPWEILSYFLLSTWENLCLIFFFMLKCLLFFVLEISVLECFCNVPFLLLLWHYSRNNLMIYLFSYKMIIYKSYFLKNMFKQMILCKFSQLLWHETLVPCFVGLSFACWMVVRLLCKDCLDIHIGLEWKSYRIQICWPI